MAGNETFSSAMASATNYKRWQIDLFRPYFGAALLEVGLGDGGLIDLLPRHERYYGLDIDAALLADAEARNPRAKYLRGDIGDPAVVPALDSAEVDTVLCFNVLEHISDDRAAVRNMADILRPGGHLLLLVPAFQALFNDLDRLAGHLRRYNVPALRRLIPENFEIARLDYVNPLGGLGWWLNRWVRHRSLESAKTTRQVLFFDRVVLPVSRALTPVTRRVFGQSVICAARKP